MNLGLSLAVAILVFGIFSEEAFAQVKGIYCGVESCYDVLGVDSSADRSTITKAYRSLARLHHPDRAKGSVAKKEAEEKFRRVANAYEILKDEEQRKEYDYMLKNPDAFYYNYYRYFRRRYGPQVDVRIVIFVIITLISLGQYYGQSSNYRLAVSELTKVTKYRSQAKDIARDRGLLDDLKKSSTKRLHSKEDLKAMEEKILSDIIQEKMDIRGCFEKPSVYNTLWLMLLLLPWYCLKWLFQNLRWFILFTLMHREYGKDEKLYLIRRHMKQTKLQFALHSEQDLDNFLEQELWRSDDFHRYKAMQADKLKERLADDSRYKRYRRYLRRGGPGQFNVGLDD